MIEIMCHRILGIGCCKSELETREQPNINEKKGKSHCRKSAVGCREPHTCVRTLSQRTRNEYIKDY